MFVLMFFLSFSLASRASACTTVYECVQTAVKEELSKFSKESASVTSVKYGWFNIDKDYKIDAWARRTGAPFYVTYSWNAKDASGIEYHGKIDFNSDPYGYYPYADCGIKETHPTTCFTVIDKDGKLVYSQLHGQQ